MRKIDHRPPAHGRDYLAGHWTVQVRAGLFSRARLPSFRISSAVNVNVSSFLILSLVFVENVLGRVLEFVSGLVHQVKDLVQDITAREFFRRCCGIAPQPTRLKFPYPSVKALGFRSR